MDLYNVVFEGKILPGKNINTVKAEFSKLFKINSQKKLDSFFAGHRVVLKKAISLELADKYERALLGAGAYCQHSLVQGESPVESIEFESTRIEQAQPVRKDDAVAVADNDSSDDAAEEEVAAIEFEHSADEALEAFSKEDVVESAQASDEANDEFAESTDDQPIDENSVAIEFEYGAVEELATVSKEDVVELEPSMDDMDEEADANRSVDQNSVAIEFEYTEVEQLASQSTDAGQNDASGQQTLKNEPVVSMSLGDLSLVPLEENEPEDEGDE